MITENATEVDWSALSQFVANLDTPGIGPAAITGEQWQPISLAVEQLTAANDLAGLIQLRVLLTSLFGQDSATGLPLLQRIDNLAIEAATLLERDAELGHFWGARGHNLHRQGFHQMAIQAFVQSAKHYQRIGKEFEAIKNIFMTALCYRAIGERTAAERVLQQVLAQVPPTSPWAGNPLQLLGWLKRDAGQLVEAESILTQALQLQRLTDDPDILVAGTLADLGELVSLQGRPVEAEEKFHESLMIIRRQQGLYNRQEARTQIKLAEHLMRNREDSSALKLLYSADDLIRAHGGYYDLLWKIELDLARLHLRHWELRFAFHKLRSSWRYRQLLGLPHTTLLRTLVRISGASTRIRRKPSVFV